MGEGFVRRSGEKKNEGRRKGLRGQEGGCGRPGTGDRQGSLQAGRRRRQGEGGGTSASLPHSGLFAWRASGCFPPPGAPGEVDGLVAQDLDAHGVVAEAVLAEELDRADHGLPGGHQGRPGGGVTARIAQQAVKGARQLARQSPQAIRVASCSAGAAAVDEQGVTRRRSGRFSTRTARPPQSKLAPERVGAATRPARAAAVLQLCFPRMFVPARRRGERGCAAHPAHRLGLFSWNRSPPRNRASTLRRWACWRISSKALKESFLRISSSCIEAKHCQRTL